MIGTDGQAVPSDPTGGGDPIRSIGQYDHTQHVHSQREETVSQQQKQQQDNKSTSEVLSQGDNDDNDDKSIWLRFEPFILHVACRSLTAASALMAAARPAFKNVGLTTWKKDDSRYVVAIWGDEGLDMPLSTARGDLLVSSSHHAPWLAQLVNDRHQRNWAKIARFVGLVRDMPTVWVDDDAEEQSSKLPRAYDMIGDVALLHALPAAAGNEEQRKVGEAIMRRNKAIKIVALRNANLRGVERKPGGVQILAGADRNPLITTHSEYGIKCVVDLRQTFFSPRMGPERLRICQQVARGEHVLVLFAGVAMESLQIAGRTEATSVTSIEINPVAVDCARRAHRMLKRNKGVQCVGAAERLQIRQGNVLEILPTLARNYFDRILAPRPKEGAMDGDLGGGDGGKQFIEALLPVLKQDGGECHWYDFVADHEFPECKRTRRLIENVCREQSLGIEVLHVARVGSVAMRQLRVCVDFRVFPRGVDESNVDTA